MSKSKTEFQIERIAFFSDAVFAISITLNPKNELYAPNDAFNAERVKLEVLFPVFVFTITTIVGCFNYFAALACFALFAFEPLFIKFVLREKKDET